MLTSGSSEDIYELTVTVGGHLFEGEFIRNEAKEDENREQAVKGKIYVKAGDKIRIPKIPSGTSFEVKESNLDELNQAFTKYDKENYKVVNAEVLATDEKASGNYEITELETIRYECKDGNVKEAELKKTALNQTVAFKNVRTNPDNYSHTDVVINKFTMDENGNIVITPDELGKSENKEN